MTRTATNIVGKNKTKEYYYKLSKTFYVLGAPNFWYGDLGIPQHVATIHDIIVWITDIAIYAYFISAIGAYFTQHNLSEKQKSDMQMFAGQPFWYVFIVVFRYYCKEVRVLGYELAVKLKKEYNDPQVEEEMVQSVKFYGGIFLFFSSSTIALFGLQGLIEFIFNGNNFVAIIPVWPDIHDTSTISGVVRVAHYVIWWIFLIRLATASYLEVTLITCCLSHQYKNLCSYFRSLNAIFEEADSTQEEKEYKYEKAFILGIEFQNSTLRCNKLAQKICYIIFSIQIFNNLSFIVALLSKLVYSEHTLANLLFTSVNIGSVLTATYSFWCSAGDITVEASQLSMAMFESGWQHCRGRAALRARTLLGVSMRHSQRPVQIVCLGFVTLSYASYVMIVRFSYQGFSVLYTR